MQVPFTSCFAAHGLAVQGLISRRPSGIALVLGAALLATTVLASPARAATVTREDVPGFPISAAVTVPAGYETVYLSGAIAPVVDPKAPKGSVAAYGDTETQTINALKRIKETLAKRGLGLGDVVMMHVYLAGDPAKGGKMDFAGMMAGYTQFFGTPEQPNKPARSAMQVAALAGPGLLVEIEVVAVKHP